MKHLKALVGTLLAVVILAGCGGTHSYADDQYLPFVAPEITVSGVHEPELADAAMLGAAKTKVRKLLSDDKKLESLDWEMFEEIEVKRAGRCFYEDGSEEEVAIFVRNGTLYVHGVDNLSEDQIIAGMIYQLMVALTEDLTDREVRYFAETYGGYLTEVYEKYSVSDSAPVAPRESAGTQLQQGLVRLSALRPPISGGLNVVA